MAGFRKALWELAHEQYGYVTRAQALRAGLTPKNLVSLRSSGEIVPVARGVYRAVAAPDHPHEHAYAVWLGLRPQHTLEERHESLDQDFIAVGDTAANIHRLAGLEPLVTEFAHPGRRQTRDSTIRFHRETTGLRNVEYIQGLPVLTPAATIGWLAKHHAEPETLTHAIDDARAANLATLSEVINALPGRQDAYNNLMSASAAEVASRAAITLRELPYMSEKSLRNIRESLGALTLTRTLDPETQEQLSRFGHALAPFSAPKLSGEDAKRIHASARRALEGLRANRSA